jgi:hypothetical protein
MILVANHKFRAPILLSDLTLLDRRKLPFFDCSFLRINCRDIKIMKVLISYDSFIIIICVGEKGIRVYIIYLHGTGMSINRPFSDIS